MHKLLLFLKTKIMYNTYLYICILENKEEEKSVIRFNKSRWYYQEPCSSFCEHFLAFSTEIFRVLIPPLTTIDL